MSTQIQYKSGEFIKFTATRDFSLGERGLVMRGTELLFDGTSAILNGGQPISLFQLRGACKSGWLVASETYNPEDRSVGALQSAGIRVRDANGGNPMNVQSRTLITSVSAEEHEVGDVASHAEQTKARNANRQQPSRFQKVGAQEGTFTVDDQEGIPVRSVTTPARQSANLEHESAAAIIRRAESVKIQPCQGRTRDEVLAAMSEEDRVSYLANLDSLKGSKTGSDRDADGQSVATIKAPVNVDASGFYVSNSVSQGSTPIADLSGATGASEVNVVEVDGIKLTNTNGPRAKKAKVVETKQTGTDSRRTIARAICSDFPDNYDFNAPVRKKLARLQADYDDRPDVIRAVAAAETDSDLRTKLVAEFPEAFSG